MYQYQSCQESELSNGIVCTHDGLSTFFTSDTDTDVSLLNHSNVVGTVTNRQCHDLEAILDHANHGGFLGRRHTTAEHGSTLLAQQ